MEQIHQTILGTHLDKELDALTRDGNAANIQRVVAA